MSHCPSCGRYAGPCGACPYCGARLAGRIPVRIIKLAAILFATLGLAALWFVATRGEVPLIQIGQAGATMNMAYVRVQGRCTRAPSYDPESGYLSFWIEDGTGEIRVSAYRAETRGIVERGLVPALGDLVEVAGTLRVREDILALTIDAPEQLRITRADPVDRDVGAIAPEDQYLRVRVRGEVRSAYEPYEGLMLITVRDETGSIPVAVSDDLIALGGVTPTLSVGQPVEVVAAVSLYGSTPQLVPASVADIVSLDQAASIAAERRIGELTGADVGRLVVVRGAVVETDGFSSGTRYTLDDGTGTVVVVVWQDVNDLLPDPAALGVGAEVQVQGEVAEYRGELELIPELAGDVQVLASASLPVEPPAATATPAPAAIPTSPPTPTPADTPTPAPAAIPTSAPTPTPGVALTSIGSLAAGSAGEEVTVEGVVVGAASFSAGFKFTLDDGSGRIVLLVWHNVYDDCWDAAGINVGARVRATGEVGEYEGELQLVPGFGGDVKAVERTSAWAAPREIGALGGGDEGQRVMIEGRVIRVEGLDSAVKVFVGDDTGEVMVFIWRSVLDRIPNNTALGVEGTRVRVVGAVEIYRSNLQVVPVLPYDVVVLEIGD